MCLIKITALFVIVSVSAMSARRVAVVTGANKGIGLNIASQLMRQHDFFTIIACRNEKLGQEAADKLGTIGKDVEFRSLDISDSGSINLFCQGLQEDYGSIDVLINNAAIAFKSADPTPFAEQAAPTFKTNFFGTIYLTSKMIPLLTANNRGDFGETPPTKGPRIVNVASQAGLLRIVKDVSLREKMASSAESLTQQQLEAVANDFITTISSGGIGSYPQTCYGFSKLCLIAYTKILARTHPGVISNACCPGKLAQLANFLYHSLLSQYFLYCYY